MEAVPLKKTNTELKTPEKLEEPKVVKKTTMTPEARKEKMVDLLLRRVFKVTLDHKEGGGLCFLKDLAMERKIKGTGTLLSLNDIDDILMKRIFLKQKHEDNF